MAKDKYLIRPTITQTQAEDDLGDGQSSLVDGDGTEAVNAHVHRIGSKVLVNLIGRYYDKDTDTWSYANVYLGQVHFSDIVNIGTKDSEEMILFSDGTYGRVKANLPEHASYTSLATGELYYCAADANHVYQK